MSEQEEQGQIYTVHFVDKRSDKTTDVKTDATGKIAEKDVPTAGNITDSTDKKVYRLLGWSKVDGSLDVVDFSKEVISKEMNLYAVWVPYAKAVVNLHYDGEKVTDTALNKQVAKVIKLDKYLAGDTIDLTSSEIDKATHTSTSGGVTYTQTGWHAYNQTELLTTEYQIPLPTVDAESVTVDLYPAWDIKAVTVGDMSDSTITTVITELKTLQKADKKYCGNVEIDSKVTVAGELTIPAGVKVTFNNEVNVSEDGYISGTVVKGKDATIVKTVTNAKNTDANVGLNDSLNNIDYDSVKLGDAITDQTNITVKAGSKAVLDLNGQNLTMTDSNKITIEAKVDAENETDKKAEGSLTIINSNKTAATVQTKDGIVNNGKLIIGEKAVDGKTKNTVKIASATGATDATLTNKKDATLTIESGEITNPSDTATTAVVKNEKGGTVVIEGGKIDASSANARIPALLNEGDATISGGEFNRSQNINGESSGVKGYYVVVNQSGTLDITGGTFKAGDTTTASSALIENGYYNSDTGFNKEPSNLTITGGNFTGGRYIIKNDYTGVAEITGGKYTALPDTTGTDTHVATKSVFKTIGEMTLDFSKATAENTQMNLGEKGTKTVLVLIGDQKLTEVQSGTNSLLKNSLTIHPFDPSLVVVAKKGLADYDKVAEKIVVEKAKSSSNITKSEIIAYVEDSDQLKAGEQLMSVIRNTIAKEMTGKSADKNKVTIKLGSDVEIASALDTNPNYEPTKDNTTLDLNGHTLKIHKLAVFQKNVTVVDNANPKSGKIVLNSDKTNNGDITIYENGNYATGVDLSKLANQEVDKAE